MITNLQRNDNRSLRALITGTLLPGFAGPRLPDWLAAELQEGLAGICLFGSNIESAEQVQELTRTIRRANPAAIIAVDEEGGDVTRLHYDAGSPYPGNAVLGRMDDPAATFASAAAIGTELRRAGCNLDLAPSVDINSNPNNPVIGVRSFGQDTSVVAEHSAAWVQGLQSTGVAACAKHFPGHGDTAQDSHLTLPTVDASLSVLLGRELEPFRAAIAAGTAAIMTSHLLVPSLDPLHPATFSKRILQDLLRTRLGFQGVVVTDALDMNAASGTTGIPAAAVRALAAGSDLLCLGSETSETGFNQIVDRITLSLQSGEQHISRLVEAQGRAASLLDRLPRPVQGEGIPAGGQARPLAGPETVGASFRLNGRAKEWLGRCRQPFELLQISSPANAAVGSVPWGPASLGNTLTAATPVRAFDPAGNGPGPFPPGTQVALVGRNLHLNPLSMELVSQLRRQDLDLIVIEMGWPSAEDNTTDVCTFGASRLVSTALMELLTRGLPQVTG